MQNLEKPKIEMPKELFSLDHINKLHAEAKKFVVPDLSACQQYLSKYFFPMTNGTHFFWTKKKDTKSQKEIWDFEFMDQITASRVWFNRMPKEINEWYIKTNTKLFISDNNIYNDRIDGEYINHSAGLKWKTRKPFADFEKKTQDAVHTMLDYLKKVLSDGNQAQADYQIKWYACVVKGRKVASCLYYKGPEGLGKSTFIDFFVEHVIGQSVSVKPSMEVLTSAFNMPLCGKLFVEFAEMPTFSTAQWVGVSGKMKDHVTGSTTYYRNVFEKGFEAANLNNYVITTNVNAIKDLGRRYCPLDCSTEYVRDYVFFQKIRDECFNDDVGFAFYNYLMEMETDKWHEERDMPSTENKLSAIADKLDPLYKFLKETYILPKKPINKKVGELHDEYLMYCFKNNLKSVTKHPFNDKLKEIQINYRKTGGHNVYEESYEKLKMIADKHKWIHELDEIPEPNPLDNGCEEKKVEKEKPQFFVEVMSKKKMPPPKVPKKIKKEKPIEIKKPILYKAKKINYKPKNYDAMLKFFAGEKVVVKTNKKPKKAIIYDIQNNELVDEEFDVAAMMVEQITAFPA